MYYKRKSQYLRLLVFLLFYIPLLGVPFYIGAATNNWILSTSFAVVFATIVPFSYRILQKKAADLLLSKQKHYQTILVQVAGGMVRERDLNRLLKLVVYIVKKVVRVKFAAVFLYNQENQSYVLNAVRNYHNIAKCVIAQDLPFIEYIRKQTMPVIFEEIPLELRKILEIKLGVPYALVIPLVIEKKLLAFMVLGQKLDRSLYTSDDINVFRILASHAALAIENCMFFEEFKKVQERIFAAEKLASIGGMTDGIAHQIKNRLNHFSVAAGELQFEISDFIEDHQELIKQIPDLEQSFKYLDKIAASIVTNVKRTNDIIQGILNYARADEKDVYYSEFSLREVIDLSLDLVKIKHEVKDFPLEIEINCSDIIYGVKSQMTEAIYNIIDNCYEAIMEKRDSFPEKEQRNCFKPLIYLNMVQTDNSTFIGISDNGIGIKEEDRSKIFAPFFTTKSSYKSGTGIGMYVVKRMVEENHQGKIWFESAYREGTKFVIELPKRIKRD